MALNFGGMGFEFSGEDTGAEKTAEGVNASLTKLWGNMKKMGPLAVSMGGKMSKGFGKMAGMGKSALGGLALAATSAVESALSPKLDTAYSSMYAGFNKSFSAMTVGMDMSTKEAKKMRRVIGNAAFALNEDMDQAATSWKAFAQQNIDLTKVMGAKGTAGAIKNLIKVTSVYNVEGEQMANVMAGLKLGYGFTEERVLGLADSMVYLGKKFNMGRDAIQAWPGILESLNNELADFGRTAKPKDIEQLTTSIVALGAGLKDSLGVSGKEGIEMAKTVFTTVMGERKNIMNMYRGMQGEVGEFGRQLAESGGSVQNMFKMIQQDPLAFMTNLRKMAADAEKRGGTIGMSFQRLSGQINSALGPNVTFAMKGGWDKVQDSMAKVPEIIGSPEAKGAFINLAKDAHKTGRTAGESWEIMMNQMEARLMRISGPLRKKWVKDMTGGFNSTISAVERMAKKDGPLGKLTQRLLLVKDVGLSALLPELGKLSPLFGGVVTSMLPVMTAFGAMGLKFSAVGKMGLAGGALFGLFYLLKHGPEEALKNIEKLGKGLIDFLVDTKMISRQTAIGILGAFHVLKTDGPFALLNELGTWFAKKIREVPWHKVGTMIGKGVGYVVTSLAEAIGELFTADSVQQTAQGPIEVGLKGAIKAALKGLVAAASGIFTGFFDKFWSYMFDVNTGKEMMGKLVKVAAFGMGAILIIAKKTGIGIGRAFTGAFRMLKNLGPIMALIEAMHQIELRGDNISKIMNSKVVPSFAKTQLAGEQAFKGILSTLDKLFFGLPSMVGKSLGITSEKLSGFYHEMVATFEKAINNIIFGTIGTLENLQLRWRYFKVYMGDLWETIKVQAMISWEGVRLSAKRVVNKVADFFDVLVNEMKKSFLSIKQAIEGKMLGLEAGIAAKILQIPKIIPMPDALRKWAKDTDKLWTEMGGEKGVERRHKTEMDRLNKELTDAQEKRLEGEKSQEAGIDRLKNQLDEAGKVWNKNNLAASKAIEDNKQANEEERLRREQGIEDHRKRAVEASKVADEELSAKRKAAEETEKETKRKRRGGKKAPPTAEERAEVQKAMPDWAKSGALGESLKTALAIAGSPLAAPSMSERYSKVEVKLDLTRDAKKVFKAGKGTAKGRNVTTL